MHAQSLHVENTHSTAPNFKIIYCIMCCWYVWVWFSMGKKVRSDPHHSGAAPALPWALVPAQSKKGLGGQPWGVISAPTGSEQWLGRSFVILVNGRFTIILGDNGITSFSRHTVRLLLLKNIAWINTMCIPGEVFSSLHSLISFIQDKLLYSLLSLIMHLLLGLLSPKAFTLNSNAASGVSSI